MSNVTRFKCLLFFFNMFNISCLWIEGNDVKISKFAAFINIMLFPFSFFISRYFSTSFFDAAINFESVRPHGSTWFFVLTYSIMMMINYVMVTICIYFQHWKRNQILNFVKSCLTFCRTHQVQSCQHFALQKRKILKKFIVLIFVMIFVYLVEFFTMMNTNWQGFIFFMFYRNNGFLIFPILGFLNCFYSYFVAIVKILNNRVESRRCYKDETLNDETVITYLMDFRHLIDEFHRSLGTFTSFVIFIIITTQIVRVRKNNFEYLNSTILIFCSYVALCGCCFSQRSN